MRAQTKLIEGLRVRRTLSRTLGVALASILIAASLHAAVVFVEDFSSGANGWGDRDPGEMAVSHESSVGAPAYSAMQGSFAAQGFPVPQTDAFRIDSGGNFVGDYNAIGNGLTQLSFDLYAEDILPSDLFIRLISGSDVFTYQFSLAGLSVDSWRTFNVNLAWSYGWNGIGQAAFNSALSSVSALEIELTRSGSAAQLYYLSNISSYDNQLPPDHEGGGGGGGDAVPEPGEGLLYLGFILLSALGRRHVIRARA